MPDYGPVEGDVTKVAAVAAVVEEDGDEEV